MRLFTDRSLCFVFMLALLVGLFGCQRTTEPPARFNENLGTQTGELLLPYVPDVSHKILQDPAQFPLPTDDTSAPGATG